MKEIWKDIPNYEGLYQVSNLGNVKSICYQGFKRELIMKPKSHHSGYKIVMLCKNGVQKNKSVHRLVAETFLEKPVGKNVVNHIDGNKSNNELSNLEWVTYSMNTRHAIDKLGFNPLPNRFLTGSSHQASKSVCQYSKDGKFIKKWDCISDASRYIGCEPCMIVNNASGRTKTAHGYIWKYEE